jgi:hypothetical protein
MTDYNPKAKGKLHGFIREYGSDEEDNKAIEMLVTFSSLRTYDKIAMFGFLHIHHKL